MSVRQTGDLSYTAATDHHVNLRGGLGGGAAISPGDAPMGAGDALTADAGDAAV